MTKEEHEIANQKIAELRKQIAEKQQEIIKLGKEISHLEYLTDPVLKFDNKR